MKSATPVDDDVSPADVAVLAEAARANSVAYRDEHKLDVVDLVTLARARQTRLDIGRKKAGIVASLKKPKAYANALHKWFCGLENAATAPLDELDQYESAQIVAFDEAQETLRKSRELALASTRRVGQDARAVVEAAALETIGEHALAASVLDEALESSAPVVVLEDEVAAIQLFKKTWHWRVSNKALIPREFLAPDEERLDKYATAMNEDAHVPGIEFYYTKTPIRR